MKQLLLICLVSLSMHNLSWTTDLEEAKLKAKTEHKYILLNFSGSDWCAPCIRMHHEIFETAVFEEMASRKLVLLNADFPRGKKNQLSKDQQQRNDNIAEQYNPKGTFPFTLLLDENGTVIKTWEGYYAQGAAAFTGLVDQLTEKKQ